MIVLAQVIAAVGWRAAVGMAVGAALGAVPAYHAGVWTERAAGEERTRRALAEHDLQRMEHDNERIRAAAVARGRAGVPRPSGIDGLHDDGFRRD